MAIYYAIVDGDPISSGGKVYVYEHDDLIEDADGQMRAMAYLGDKAFCEACQFWGEIIGKSGIPDYLRMVSNLRGGRRQAVSGDGVLCKCRPTPVLIPRYAIHDQLEDIGDEEGGESGLPADYDQRFRLVNPHTQQPLVDMPYRIALEDGSELVGRTDAQGYTERISSDQALTATLHVFDDVPPVNPDWDKHL